MFSNSRSKQKKRNDFSEKKTVFWHNNRSKVITGLNHGRINDTVRINAEIVFVGFIVDEYFFVSDFSHAVKILWLGFKKGSREFPCKTIKRLR